MGRQQYLRSTGAGRTFCWLAELPGGITAWDIAAVPDGISFFLEDASSFLLAPVDLELATQQRRV